MNKNELEKRFDLVKENSHYVLVSDDHPLELFLGKNEEGCLTLRYNGNFVPIKIKSNDILKVKQVRLKNYNSILFTYKIDEDPSIFFSFCEDVINSTENCNKDNGYTELVNRYSQWKKLFYSSKDVLTEPEIIGLIGELLFLKECLFEKYGKSMSLNGWTGPEPTHKDFSFTDIWYEIKTINSFKKSVSISSIEQLDSDFEGKLVVYQLQKMSPSFNGITLNKLVQSILNILEVEEDKDVFVDKLKQARYSYNEYYDDFVYEFTSRNTYSVKEGFPRITKDMISEGIGNIKYELMLIYIEKFREE